MIATFELSESEDALTVGFRSGHAAPRHYWTRIKKTSRMAVRDGAKALGKLSESTEILPRRVNRRHLATSMR